MAVRADTTQEWLMTYGVGILVAGEEKPRLGTTRVG
jgi:hypothetical protein